MSDHEAMVHGIIDLHIRNLLLNLYVAKPAGVSHQDWCEDMESYLGIYVADRYDQWVGETMEL